jgi:predicted helicase
MRQSLINSFDEIYILDLHGNSLKKEKAPDGSKDENVFDIQQGVAISLFVKKRESKEKKTFSHSELWGLREQKYKALQELDVKDVKWKILKPISPFYFFVPREEKLLRRFQSYRSVPEIFPVNSVGIVTARDHFVVDFDKSSLRRRIEQFVNPSLDDALIAKTFDLTDTGAWKLKTARKLVASDEERDSCYTQILYRPFDVRQLFYHDALIERGRKEVMRHMLQENCAIVLPRRVETAIPWSHVFVSNQIVEHVAVSLKTIDYCLPLYVYEESVAGGSSVGSHGRSYQAAFVFEPHAGYSARKPNLNSKLLSVLESGYKKQPTPAAIFNYIYAILHSNAYRTKYSEFLRTDFPRVPFTSSPKVFGALVKKGEELVALHLLKSKRLAKPIAAFEGDGENRVEKVTYGPRDSRVYVNPAQYFTGVNSDVWGYRIGGYQVAEKWLKDRKGRMLSSEEVMHYCRVMTALSETIKVQDSLDELFEEVEKSVLDMRAQVSTVRRSHK